jgi:hypothetical protein
VCRLRISNESDANRWCARRVRRPPPWPSDLGLIAERLVRRSWTALPHQLSWRGELSFVGGAVRLGCPVASAGARDEDADVYLLT